MTAHGLPRARVSAEILHVALEDSLDLPDDALH
jgi:hypothetical protein